MLVLYKKSLKFAFIRFAHLFTTAHGYVAKHATQLKQLSVQAVPAPRHVLKQLEAASFRNHSARLGPQAATNDMAANGGGKGRGGGGAPPGPPQEHPSMVPGGDEGDPPSTTSFQNARGLDSGLAKAAPSAKGLSSKTYRAYRRRLQLFSKQCSHRGPNVAVEGAFLALSLLQELPGTRRSRSRWRTWKLPTTPSARS